MAGSFQLNRRPLLTILVGAMGAALIAAGCRESPAPRPPRALAIDIEALDKARHAMGRREYVVAVPLLREALTRRPDDLETHYRLGVSASHLDHQREARKEFEWVVSHGRPGAPEVQLARDWLATRTVPVQPAPAVPRVGVGVEPSPPNPQMATLAGRAVGPDGVKSRLQLFLKGVPGTAVKDEYHILRTDPQGTFRFADVVPGDYMLTDAVAGSPAWRLRVLLAKGEHLVLDLSPANQAPARDDFPETRP